MKSPANAANEAATGEAMREEIYEEIDTTNKFLVAGQGDKLLIMNPPRGPITNADALLLAAYLVALAGGREDFEPVLEAVEGS